MDLRMPRSTRRLKRLGAAVVAAAVVAGGGTWAAAGDEPAPVHQEDRFLPGAAGGGGKDVRIDTSFFTAGPASERRPAVLLAHGFGGSKRDLQQYAETMARDGYAVLTWSARGFGKSGGRIGLNDRENEVADVERLVDWLAERPEVQLDASGDPRVGVAGASYGGAISLLAAGNDKRIDAIAPQNTYWDLSEALFPDGVFKKLWAGIFFSTGSTPVPTAMGPAAEEAPDGGPGGQDGTEQGVGGQGGTGQNEPAPGDDGAAGTAPGEAAPGETAPSGPVPPVPAEDPNCGRFEKPICEMYERVAVAGEPDEAAVELLRGRSPVAVGDRIDVPTLVLAGQTDSLFPLSHADAMARQIEKNGAPVSVDWVAGGHDGGDQETERVQQRVTGWFDHYLKGQQGQQGQQGGTEGGSEDEREGGDTGPAFRISRTGGVDSTDGRARLRGATGESYPGLGGSETRTVGLTGREQTATNPAGATPAAVSSVPGLGSMSQLSTFGVGVSLDFPGQTATFDSAPLSSGVRVTGSPTVGIRVESDSKDAVLFAKVYDVGPSGSQLLPAQLVSPVRIDGTGEKDGRTAQVRLPAVDHNFEAGHRMRLVLSATDMGYASPVEPAEYRVSLDKPGALAVPTATEVQTVSSSLPWWTWGLPLSGVVLAAALLLAGRRRTAVPAPEPELAEVPLQITGLSKRYAKSADRYAVKDLSIRVESGQVLGLLGPNGAGKTTTLRMLMGLIRPDAGEVRVFGHAIRPGAPVLSRVGAFVEGAGFLPHLTGRANLDLYWQATGRPAADAHLDEALEIAGLGDALERAVRTYSQGMRQRLAIAQAMLGLPDLLILDEPTNGLDPPQIREMREVLIQYAKAGRTVIVSSHLLSEVEQSCTHLVVMDRGRLVSAGPVEEITGSGDTLLVSVAGEPPSEAVVDEVAALSGVGSAVRAEGGLLVRLDSMTSAQLLVELVRLEIPVDRVGPHRRLEDAFLTLIGGAQ